MNHIFYLFFLLCITGCGIKKTIQHTDLKNREIIAKCADLPDVPFTVKLQSISINPDDQHQIQMFYTSAIIMDELVDFYQQQMERCGWELLAKSHAKDCLLHYVKPMQVCSILISKDRLTIYLSDKKDA